MVGQARTNAGFQPLKRVRSSDWDIRLTCTAAIEKRPLEDWVGLQVFEVRTPQDLSAKAAFSELMLSKSIRETPRYSVTVFLDPESPPERPMLVVGIARQESWRDHLMGCLFTEDGCNFSYALKKIVAPVCAKMR
jgi:hypothetical protein